MTTTLEDLVGDPRAIALARELADFNQTQIAEDAVADQLTHWSAEGTPAQWRPWVDLIEPWKAKKFEKFKDSLTTMLLRAQRGEEIDAVTTMVILRTIASFTGHQADPETVALVRPFVDQFFPQRQAGPCFRHHPDQRL